MRHVAVRESAREAILDAANRLLIRYGYKKMTMDDLAQEAGIGKGTIYLYFRSKEEIALSCADRLTRAVQARLREAAQCPSPPSERIRHMLMLRVLIRFDHAQPYARSLDDLFMALRPGFRARREQWLTEEIEIFAEVLAEGSALGVFHVPEPKAVAAAMLLATNSLLPFSLSPQELGEREEIERKVTHVTDLLLHGILRREAQSHSARDRRKVTQAEHAL
jgi:AcrR family transcriptional regulator